MFLCCATLKEHAVPLSHWVGSCRHRFPDEPTQIVNHRATSSLTRYLPATLRTTQCCIVEESCHVQAIQHLHDSPMCSAQTPPSSMALPELSRPEFNNMATGWVSTVTHTHLVSHFGDFWKQGGMKTGGTQALPPTLSPLNIQLGSAAGTTPHSTHRERKVSSLVNSITLSLEVGCVLCSVYFPAAFK